ncbi:hypothetical protein [Sphingobium sp.]|uniref:hypothetical protein n=1 Tax=Sphingobium sp. TaxID=1912891 RepID=UPI0028BD74A2|nr:hypothetical protein [Sphingobium sp.]
MTPDPSAILVSVTRTLSQFMADHPETAPEIGIVMSTLSMLAADVDSHVAQRLQWGQEIERLLRLAREKLSPSARDIVDRALEACPAGPADYATPMIEAWLDRLMNALTVTHAELETAGDRQLVGEIWTFLTDYVTTRGRLVRPLWRV